LAALYALHGEAGAPDVLSHEIEKAAQYTSEGGPARKPANDSLAKAFAL
jgi:hypothetical protein